MPREPMSDRDWVLKNYQGLQDTLHLVEDVHPEVVESVGPWSVLKELAIKNSLGMYLPIIASQPWARVKTFIDTNASCGINHVRDTAFKLPGSSILGAATKTKFDRYFYIEPDARKREALAARLASLLDMEKVTILEAPADEAIPSIMAQLPSRDAHFFAIVDPYSLSAISWKGLSALMAHPGDLLINLQTTLVKRHHRPAEAFYGTPDVRTLIERDAPEAELRDFFLGRVKALRPATEFITVKAGASRYYYDLVYAAASTNTGSPWLNAVRGVKRRVEHLDGDDVLAILQNVGLRDFRRKQPTLADFPDEEPDADH